MSNFLSFRFAVYGSYAWPEPYAQEIDENRDKKREFSEMFPHPMPWPLELCTDMDDKNSVHSELWLVTQNVAFQAVRG